MTRILIVNSENAAAGEFSGFSREGYAITTCKSVIAATALVEEIRPRVVFTDVSLRGARISCSGSGGQPAVFRWRLRTETKKKICLVGFATRRFRQVHATPS